MEENKYKTAGIVSIIIAVLFPAGFALGIVQSIVGIRAFEYRGPSVGPSDLIFLASTVMMVYVLVKLRQYLNERYDFHQIDTLITIAIWWNIIFQFVGFLVKIGYLIFLPQDDMTTLLVFLPFMLVMLITGGIIDIIFGIRLLKINDPANDTLKFYAYFTLVSGCLMVTIIFTPLTILLVPIGSVVLGILFLKDKDRVEFV